MRETTKQRLGNVAIGVAVLVAAALVWAGVRHSGEKRPVAPMPRVAEFPVPKPVPVAKAPVVAPLPPVMAPVGPQVVQTAPAVASGPAARALRVRNVPAGGGAVPDARTALAGVGQDPAAQRVWETAINDTVNMAAGERRNLIEDLNESGFADPRNLTQADLPLINARIALIEQLASSAADATNAAAFEEAHKDLVAMRVRLTGQ